ncbi:putative Disease resistance protein RPS5 [Corchorus olitorius]|uniref:Disease resistance protein RPS5 n=1 Tax=Corchorus olitorius TaxID=93759 RepID=A0A1R3H905_9ROSI|nr:putative Disease resistance protein RPS5 [Corchorus olitorius]
MSSLQVLDLSGNQGLVELPPEIGILRTLQYLNLSLTSIRQLPTGLANLRNLRCLLLDYNTNLKGIPPIVISCLSLLQVYSKMNGVMDYFDEVEASADDEIAFLEVLEKMSCLNKICITIFAAPSVEMILNSFKLRHCIRKLTLMECSGLTSLLLISPEGATSNRRKIEIFRNLTRFELFRCCSLKQIIMSDSLYLPNLHQVYIGVCPLLLNLNCLAYAINLKILTVLDCESMEEIISESSEEEKAFPKLKTISLTRLRKLKSISRSPISSSSLFEIEVSQCPSLKQLPLDIESADFLKKIRGETEWWEGLIWDREVVKDACSSKFVSTSSSRFRPPGKTKDQISSTSKG